MTEKEKQFAEAATRIVQRYGMKRTTMGDIATEAGVSRQTLYTVYPSKEEVLRGIIRLITDRAMASVEKECAAQNDVKGKLTAFFEHVVLEPYRMISAMPDSADFVIGFEQAAKEELGKSYATYRVAMRGVLAPYRAAIEAAGLTVDGLSDYVIGSARSFKKEAADEKELKELLGVMTTLVVSITG